MRVSTLFSRYPQALLLQQQIDNLLIWLQLQGGELRFQCEQEAFLSVVQAAGRAVSPRATQPALMGLLIRTGKDDRGARVIVSGALIYYRQRPVRLAYRPTARLITSR